jgi:hypothetical protein
MRLYGGRKIHGAARRQVDARRELRDAIVYSVDSTIRYAMVKIQGTDTQIKAHYPENWEQTPAYLKPGNAVRITHPGGNRGRIEIAGYGFLIPTAVPGGSVTPPAAVPDDAILTGMVLQSYATDPGWSAWVTTGTYRIDGVTYTFGAVAMGDADMLMDRDDITMGVAGGSGGSVTFDAADSSHYRYDLVVIGTDGVLDVVKGANTSGVPVMPGTPADHVLIGWVLFYPNMTEIAAPWLYGTYTAPAIKSISFVVGDDQLSDVSDCESFYAPGPCLCSVWLARSAYDVGWYTPITATIRNQYGNALSGSWLLEFTFLKSTDHTFQYGAASGSSLTIPFTGHSLTVNFVRGIGRSPGIQIAEIGTAPGTSIGLHINLYENHGAAHAYRPLDV